jgi:SAM-dependent methyltransferase
VNEYVFCYAKNELSAAHSLRDALITAFGAGDPVPPAVVLTVATYFPLSSIPLAETLLNEHWPAPVAPILAQQIAEPEQERSLRLNIPTLTRIEDPSSRAVQTQYEDNPYPRWIKEPPTASGVGIVKYFSRKFSSLSFRSPSSGEIDILVAGCGTGSQAVATARQFRACRVQAIDLSLASLAYAKRKTLELGITSISYSQADILNLEWERAFDIVTSVGVLHHLADPWMGWKKLVSMVRPGGFMNVGLYSRLARREITRIRKLIEERNYGCAPDEIRQFRQDLVAIAPTANFEKTTKLPDFFSLSMCRDLLFHVKEHCFVLADIVEFLRDNELIFLGFDLPPSVLRSYREHFPNDPAAINLGQWQIFEDQNPDTFIGMYQFWIQKP